jgi:hypothetical protein
VQLLLTHPLAFLRNESGAGAEVYLRRVAARHAALGFGAMATRREKMSRWEHGCAVPELTAQLAIAALHGVPAEAVRELGWPDWLLLALAHCPAIELPWTHQGMLGALTDTARGGPMDRRGFLIATGGTVTGAGEQWLTSSPVLATGRATGRVAVGHQMVDHLEQRLDHVRRMDDAVGGGTLRAMAAEELRGAERLLRRARYSSDVGRRLHTTVAEAARINGWLAFDAGQHAAAQRYYLTSLRAARAVDDQVTGANTLAFMAIQTYSVGDPADAVRLMDVAQEGLGSAGTPRLKAMLHFRKARAHSKVGDRADCARELEAARAEHVRGTHDDDPAWCYWIDEWEIEYSAGSSALDLGDPATALGHFEGALAPAFGAEGRHRDHAQVMVRAAEAHLARRDVETACHRAGQAVDLLDGVSSKRSTGSLDSFRSKLSPHRQVPAVHEFLEKLAG